MYADSLEKKRMSKRAELNGRLSRREFVKRSAGALGSLAVSNSAIAGTQVRPTSGQRRPNFLFILTNGHRPGALSLTGNQIVQTPLAFIPIQPAVSIITIIARFQPMCLFLSIFCALPTMKLRCLARHMSAAWGKGIGITTSVSHPRRQIIFGQ